MERLPKAKVVAAKKAVINLRGRMSGDAIPLVYTGQDQRKFVLDKDGNQRYLDQDIKPSGDSINHPSYYNQGKIEVIDFLEDQNLDYKLTCVIKYVCRAPHKGKYEEDLKKAMWYLQRSIDKYAQGHEGALIKKPQGER